MDRPRIGITTYPRRGERLAFSMPSAYVDAVRAAGGLPFLLPPGEEAPAELLEHVDGLVFSGGGDLHPGRFAAEQHPTVYGVSEERDAFELALMQAALERRTPTLAICRGLQVLNVVLGGDLHLHLPEVTGNEVPHRRSGASAVLHPVQLAEDSDLAVLYGRHALEVQSWHHQAVDRLGRGLRAVGWAADGTVEAVELPGESWLLAVQWHPELDAEAGRPGHPLFGALTRRAAARRGGPCGFRPA
jgi:putative glutamine amidotransferase